MALLIGNQGYSTKVGRLKNPHNDVSLIEASLKQLGFKVTVLKDANYKAMDSALKRYVTEVRRAGRNTLSLFYYSDHGVANPSRLPGASSRRSPWTYVPPPSRVAVFEQSNRNVVC